MCHVPVIRTAPGPSRIHKGGRNHGQSRHWAHPPATTVTCLQAWVTAGRAGGIRVFSTLHRDRDELLLYASRSAPQRTAITLPERVHACVAETPRPFCRCLCHHFRHGSPASMAGQCGGQSDNDGASSPTASVFSFRYHYTNVPHSLLFVTDATSRRQLAMSQHNLKMHVM